MAEITVPELILPIVHLNGTSGNTLMGQREAVFLALEDAQKAFSGMAPNARDYYVVDGLMSKAQAQHERRVLILKALQDEIEAEITALDDVIHARERR
jgi:hypothetical protein